MPLTERRYSGSSGALVPELKPLTTYLFERESAERPAFSYLDYSTDRAGTAHTLSWAKLASKVRATAAELTQITSKGQRVAILAPQDLSYVIGFLGALHAGAVAVPLFAPEVSQHGARLVGALADCAPDVWLTAESALPQVCELAENNPVPMPKQILAIDSIAEDAGAQFRAPAVDLDEPAYLQYTSGSTREPAGAVITHRALASNAWQSSAAFGVDESWTCAGWIPFFHDMGLVQLLCLPVMSGARSVFMTPFDFIMRPIRWIQQMSDFSNVFSAAPNFAFEYATRKVKQADRANLDLSGVRALINGSEPVRPATITGFAEAFGPCGFAPTAHRPSYGLAEATVFVTNTGPDGPSVISFDRAELAANRAVARERGSEGSLELVAAGTSHGQLIRIVDPTEHTVRPDGAVGEIWIHGPNVAQGYWQQPERTAETFDARIVQPSTDEPTEGWLRTGDLGVVHEGLLYITGRIKDLVIIDGKNHYPQDIEATVQDAHPAVRRDHVAAFAVTSDTDEGVGVVAEYAKRVEQQDVDQDEVAKAIRRAVSSVHDVKLRGVMLVRPGTVQRTSSGKIARSATKQHCWDRGGEVRAQT